MGANWRRRLAPLATVLLLAWTTCPAGEWYVTPGGAGDRGGTNWHNAFSNVQDAVEPASVRLQPGAPSWQWQSRRERTSTF